MERKSRVHWSAKQCCRILGTNTRSMLLASVKNQIQDGEPHRDGRQGNLKMCTLRGPLDEQVEKRMFPCTALA